jgi:hypothetical protein
MASSVEGPSETADGWRRVERSGPWKRLSDTDRDAFRVRLCDEDGDCFFHVLNFLLEGSPLRARARRIVNGDRDETLSMPALRDYVARRLTRETANALREAGFFGRYAYSAPPELRKWVDVLSQQDASNRVASDYAIASIRAVIRDEPARDPPYYGDDLAFELLSRSLLLRSLRLGIIVVTTAPADFTTRLVQPRGLPAASPVRPTARYALMLNDINHWTALGLTSALGHVITISEAASIPAFFRPEGVLVAPEEEAAEPGAALPTVLASAIKSLVAAPAARVPRIARALASAAAGSDRSSRATSTSSSSASRGSSPRTSVTGPAAAVGSSSPSRSRSSIASPGRASRASRSPSLAASTIAG